ncbi:unnamed protein product [Cyberlindnera jadinii]|uniref:Secreted protein n=1 Tax=Cyberlindnera jadinii (strain ATCC 18201 / CBS 1600 / BCRC 20928 / JCM 3617 / NBRC 0987 / NRRL Y-1542) TaxID=983966 RepID=A0A0H5CA44_CYBJN|nr:unnamed protein product [Cyberlindnera jadinii]
MTRKGVNPTWYRGFCLLFVALHTNTTPFPFACLKGLEGPITNFKTFELAKVMRNFYCMQLAYA